jgi:16S rRNA pseudouridine516 synthase
MPARLEILDPPNEVMVTIREGKLHQIKRMFAAVGREVVYLKRLSMGPLHLDERLPAGAYRRLTEEEESAIMGA